MFYLRLFHPSRHACIIIWGGIVFTVVFYVSCTIAQVKTFVPPKGESWMSTKKPASYAALTTISSIQGVIGAVTDFYILLIPIHLVIGLRLPLGRKLGVCAIFLTGLGYVSSWLP